MKIEVISEKPINSAELREHLESQKDLNFRAQKTLEYLQQTVLLDAKKASSLLKKLGELNVSRLKELHFNKIVDTLPKTPDDVKTIMQGYNVTVSNENLKKIADTVIEVAGQ